MMFNTLLERYIDAYKYNNCCLFGSGHCKEGVIQYDDEDIQYLQDMYNECVSANLPGWTIVKSEWHKVATENGYVTKGQYIYAYPDYETQKGL